MLQDVKMKLASVSYFCYYPAGRVIVKQFREGHSLYFIMSGEVAVSITMFDPILSEMKTITVGTMVAGQMFGEVSLLHDIPRTATITTISKSINLSSSSFNGQILAFIDKSIFLTIIIFLAHTEMIVLHKHDFNVVLKSSLQAVWDQILSAMARFTYFDGWDDVSMRECCIYSKMKTYRMGNIVYGGGDHDDNFVHFLMKGQCRCIEELPIIEVFYGGVKSYRLFDREEYKKQVQQRRKSLKSMMAISRMSTPTFKKSDKDVGVQFHRKEDAPARRHSEAHKRRASDATKRKASLGTTVITAEHAPHHPEDSLKKEDEILNTDDLKKKLGIFEEVEEEIETPAYVKTIFMQVIHI